MLSVIRAKFGVGDPEADGNLPQGISRTASTCACTCVSNTVLRFFEHQQHDPLARGQNPGQTLRSSVRCTRRCAPRHRSHPFSKALPKRDRDAPRNSLSQISGKERCFAKGSPAAPGTGTKSSAFAARPPLQPGDDLRGPEPALLPRITGTASHDVEPVRLAAKPRTLRSGAQHDCHQPRLRSRGDAALCH